MQNKKTIVFVKKFKSAKNLFYCEKKSIELWDLRLGEALSVCTKDFLWFRARAVEILEDKCILKAFEKIKNPEPEIFTTLYQAVPEKERMELIIEKAAELGVSKIVPVITAKSSTIEKRDQKQKKSHNWPKLALKASKQCRRGSILQICPETELKNCFFDINSGIKIFLNEHESDFMINEINPRGAGSVCIFNGPEGGFSDFERELFKKNNVMSVSLGPRILRTETAAISASALVLSLKL